MKNFVKITSILFLAATSAAIAQTNDTSTTEVTQSVADNTQSASKDARVSQKAKRRTGRNTNTVAAVPAATETVDVVTTPAVAPAANVVTEASPAKRQNVNQVQRTARRVH